MGDIQSGDEAKPPDIYPCVRAAMPIASGFVGELIVLAGAGLAYLRSKKSIVTSPALYAGAFFVLGIGGSLWVNDITNSSRNVHYPDIVLDANDPVGVAKGIFPGRVVWVHDSTATNQKCVLNSYGHGWFMPENNNQPVVDAMVSAAIRQLTGTTNDSTAWDSIFVYFNRNHGKG